MSLPRFLRKLRWHLAWRFQSYRRTVRRAARGVRRAFVFGFREFRSLLPLALLKGWCRSRQTRNLVYGFPALIAIISLASFYALGKQASQGMISETDFTRAVVAASEGNDALANLFLRRASLRNAGSSENLFQHALLYRRLGNDQQVQRIIQELAPDDQPGFIPAHLWRIEQLRSQLALNLQQDPQQPATREQRDQITQAIESQWRSILQVDPDHGEANDQMAVILLARGDSNDACLHLSRIVDQRPQARVIYAQQLAKLGRSAEARQQATLAMDFHQAALEKSGDDDIQRREHRRQLSLAYSLLDRPADAAAVLLDRGHPPTDLQTRQLLANVYYEWSQSLAGQDDATQLRRLKLLARAISIQPTNEASLRRVAEMSGGKGAVAREAAKLLQEILATGKAPAVVHFVLGAQATRSGDLAAATRHYEAAYRANPDSPMTLNNLADVLAQQQPPDLARAFQLATRAIQLDSTNSAYLTTRGEILMKLGHWKAAIANLEAALQRSDQQAKIHRNLSVCFTAEGDVELADLHRRRAERLEANNEAAKP